ncbi:hypothetical protein ACFQU7_25305 [Pseudoroseomonas wenyumeiae]
MEYEVVLDELGTELLVEDPAMTKPLQEGAAVAVALDPAGAVVVPA